MRARAGVAIALLGVLASLLGAALMVFLGPDGRIVQGPHALRTDGIAIVTRPQVVNWAGIDLSVLAELPANKPVFVGLGNAVDVNDYLRHTRRVEIERFQPPWKLRTRTIQGRDNLPSAPTTLDWWLAHDAGLGGANLTTAVGDQTVSLVVLAVGSSNLRGLTLTVSYGVRGGFALGAGLLSLGLGAVLLGRLLRRGDTLWPAADEEMIDEDAADAEVEIVEEVIYVHVDEDGVEHAISEAELGDYEIVEEPERP